MGKKNNNGGGIFIRNTINENYFHNVAFENLKGNSKIFYLIDIFYMEQ